MLVLSRKQSQQIVLNFGGEQATLEVLKVNGNRVRIGITAPTTVGVHRAEVWATICLENDAIRLGQSD